MGLLKKLKKMFIILILILILIYIGLVFYVAYGISHQHFPSKDNVSASLISENYEDVSFQTKDGVTLKGWFFPGNDKVLILAHGITQNRQDRGYYFVPLIRDLLSEGYSVLTFDFRAHGSSSGRATTYGLKEANDVKAAVDFVNTKGFQSEKIAIVANSFGAISTLMAAKDLDVGSLVIDSVPSEFKPVFIRRLWQEKHIPTFVTPTALFVAEKLYGLDLEPIKPLARVKEVPDLPILFLHAENDPLFLIDDANKVAEAHPTSKFVVFPDGLHIETYKLHPNLWKREVWDFLGKNFKSL
ncbi:MAG: alpha/beta fold hydrolase [Candidatus Woykebacteria bacterium]